MCGSAVIQRSEAIKAGLRKGFQDGSSKMINCTCYGNEVGPDGELAVNPDEAQVVCWIFEQYLSNVSNLTKADVTDKKQLKDLVKRRIDK